MSAKPISIRLDAETEALVDKAIEVSGAPNRSEWVRDALVAGAQAEIAEHDRRNRPAVTNGSRQLGMTATPVSCTHPPTARWQGIAEEVCTLCGTVLRRRI